jgi:mRNA-degrading endonuclease RelE of RelBE toxin-antitoxin system
MASGFELQYTRFFEKQWLGYDEKTRHLIEDKLRLIKQNPLRYGTLEGYTRVRKIKLSVEGKYQRLLYALHTPQTNQILVLGVFEREKDYKDFERLFGQYKK